MVNKLKEIRTAQGMTALDLAMKIGVSENYIYMLEAGRKKPSIDVALDIAKVLCVKIDDIWGYSDGK